MTSSSERRPSDASSVRTLLGHEQEVGGDALGRAGEVGPEVRALGGDPGLAGVAVAGPQHDAALGDHRRGAEAVLVGAEQGGDDHVASGLEPAVDADADAAAQAVVDERPLGVGQAELPGHARRA